MLAVAFLATANYFLGAVMENSVPEMTLDLLGELMRRMQRDIAVVKDDMSALKDQLLVQGAILLRLEQRVPLTQNNEALAAMHQQLLRMDRRLKALEDAE